MFLVEMSLTMSSPTNESLSLSLFVFTQVCVSVCVREKEGELVCVRVGR